MNNRYMIIGMILLSFFGTVAIAQGTGTAMSAISTATLSTVNACNTQTIVYAGNSIKCGNFRVKVADISQNDCIYGNTSVHFEVFYKGVLRNDTTVFQYNSTTVNDSVPTLTITVNRTFDGIYKYQKWAQVSLTQNGVCSTPLTIMYQGNSMKCGSYRVKLMSLYTPVTCSSMNVTAYDVYTNGVLTNVTSSFENQTEEFNVSGDYLFVHVGNAYFSKVKHDGWAQLTLAK